MPTTSPGDGVPETTTTSPAAAIFVPGARLTAFHRGRRRVVALPESLIELMLTLTIPEARSAFRAPGLGQPRKTRQRAPAMLSFDVPSGYRIAEIISATTRSTSEISAIR